MVAHSVFDVLLRGLSREAVFGLADELRITDEDGNERAATGDEVVTRDLVGLAVASEFAVSANAFEDGGPEAGLMCAAFGGRDGVTVGLDETVARWGPVDGPLDFTGFAEFLLKVDETCEGGFGVGGRAAEGFAEVVGEAAGEVECGLGRGFAVVDAGFPADFDAGEKVGFGARHFEEAGRLHLQLAEDLTVGVESHGSATAVIGGAEFFDRALRDPA